MPVSRTFHVYAVLLTPASPVDVVSYEINGGGNSTAGNMLAIKMVQEMAAIVFIYLLPLPQLWHLLWAFVEGGDDFGVGEGAGVDADFVVGRGDESAEDEHRGLLPRRLACAFAEAGVVLVELEQHAAAVLLARNGVEVNFPVNKQFPVAYGLAFAKRTNHRHPLSFRPPCPENAVVIAVRCRSNFKYEVVFSPKALVRSRSPDLDCERGERDGSGGEFYRRAGLKRDNAVLRLGIAIFGRRDVPDGIGEAVREGPAMNDTRGTRYDACGRTPFRVARLPIVHLFVVLMLCINILHVCIWMRE